MFLPKAKLVPSKPSSPGSTNDAHSQPVAQRSSAWVAWGSLNLLSNTFYPHRTRHNTTFNHKTETMMEDGGITILSTNSALHR